MSKLKIDGGNGWDWKPGVDDKKRREIQAPKALAGIRNIRKENGLDIQQPAVEPTRLPKLK